MQNCRFERAASQIEPLAHQLGGVELALKQDCLKSITSMRTPSSAGGGKAVY